MIDDVPPEPDSPTDDTWVNRALNHVLITEAPVIDLSNDDPYERLAKIREKIDLSLDLAAQLTTRLTSLVGEARHIISNELPGLPQSRRKSDGTPL